MEQKQIDKRPFCTLRADEQTKLLQDFTKQAFFRRSRQLPTNFAQMVDTLKGDILHDIPNVPVGVMDLAITTSTLNDTDASLSVAFFFQAVKKHFWQPKQNRHDWDEDPNSRPDFEADTIALLDTCAAMLKRMDDRKDDGTPTVGNAIAKVFPAFNARREYAYLVMRNQFAEDSFAHFVTKAIQDVNEERLRSQHHRVERDKALQDPDVVAQCRRLAVLDWLRSCNTTGTSPSAVLSPLTNEQQYQEFRRMSA